MQTLDHAWGLAEPPPEAGLTALVVGPELAFFALVLSPLVRKVLYLDWDAARLASAERFLGGLDNVGFRLVNGSHLPLPAESVDMAFTFLPQESGPLAAPADVARVLKPGGRLYVLRSASANPHAFDQFLADLGLELVQEIGPLLSAPLVLVYGRKFPARRDRRSAAASAPSR
jgi:SAM-dependent methyltransferase